MLRFAKLGVVTFFAAFIVGLVFGPELSADTAIPTIEQYEKYLEEKRDPESLQLKKQFSLNIR